MEDIVIDELAKQNIYLKKGLSLYISGFFIIIIVVNLYIAYTSYLFDIGISWHYQLFTPLILIFSLIPHLSNALKSFNKEPVLEIDEQGFYYYVSGAIKTKIYWRDVKSIELKKIWLSKSLILTIEAKPEYLEKMNFLQKFYSRKRIKTEKSFQYGFSSMQLDTDMDALFEKIQLLINEKAV